MKSRRQAPPQITERDRETLAMLAEHRVVVAPQIARLLGVSDQAAGARLRRLRSTGLIASQRIFDGQPAAVWITRQGLAAIERRLPAPRIDLKWYRHDIGVAWLWLAARDAAFGAIAEVVSEREMRSHDMRADRSAQPFGVGIGGFDQRGQPARHYPDLLLSTPSGKRVALELELTPKSAGRMATIMRAYAGDGRINGVLYVVPRAQLGHLIADAAAQAGIGHLVRVQRLANGRIHGTLEHGGQVPAGGRAPLRRVAGHEL